MVAIAVLDDYQKVARRMADWSGLEKNHRVVFLHEHLADTGVAARALAEFDCLAVMRERTSIDRALLERLPALKLIVTTAHRNAAIDMQAATARGIVVCGTEAPGSATAELAVGLMLGLARNFPIEAANMRAGRWQTTVGVELRGRTLGLIGLGRLGAYVANIARAFGMTPIAWSQNLTPERAAAGGAERVDKDDLFRRADFISIHTRLSERTRGLVGARELALMKPSAFLINTSRGPIVDDVALVAALAAGRIAGAGLDVYDVEPLPAGHPLRSAPRLLLTPHIGYVTEETYRVFYPGTVRTLEAWLAGSPINVIPA